MAQQQRQEMVENLIHAALALDPARRAAFLNDSCQSDTELLNEVQSAILGYVYGRPSSFLASPAHKRAALSLVPREHSPLEGQSLGHYQVLNLIGRGGMGEVYRAQDVKLSREVAIKVLPEAYARDHLKLKRFEQEARVLANLEHPNICTLHDIGSQEGVDYLVMEYIRGETLSERLVRARLSVEDSLRYAIQVADALDKAHRRGITHRDIKPGNIVITEGDQVKLLDFGLAKLTEETAFALDAEGSINEASTAGIKEWAAIRVDTGSGIAMGTVNYMSPEQARALDVDGRSDIFSLGVTIYQMITGRLPFEGDSNGDVLVAILEAEPTPLSALAPETPAELQRIISRTLCKDREQRYQTSGELLTDLRSVKEAMDLAAALGRRSDGATALLVPQPTPRPSRRVRTALLTAVLIGGVLWSDNQVDSGRLSSLKSEQLYRWQSERGEGPLSAKFSHDGSAIAYSSISGRRTRIWVKQALSGTDPMAITVDETNNWSPIWSPDDREIAFISTRENETGIWSVPAFGGAATLLKTVEERLPEPVHWSKDGNTIYYQTPSNLYALDLASKATSQVTNFQATKSGPRRFSISSDEMHIAYTDTTDGQSDVWIAQLRGGDAVRVTNDPEEDQSPIWHPDGRVFYSSKRAGVLETCIAYLDGRPPLQLTAGSGGQRVSDISADGTQILEVSTRNDVEIYGVEVDTGREFEVAHEVGLNAWPEVSPDGGMIAFQSTSPGGPMMSSSIIVRSMFGASQKVAYDGFNLKWSPDGSQLAFLRFSEGEGNIFVVNAGGGSETQLTTGGIYVHGFSLVPFNRLVSDYSWSPDGTRIVYSSRKSGAINIWTVCIDGSEDVQVSSNVNTTHNLYGPLYSRDGRRIAYVSETRPTPENRKRVWSLHLAEQGESRIILRADSFIRLVGWSHSKGGLIIAVDKDGRGAVGSPMNVAVLQVTADGKSRQITSLESAYVSTAQLSPDERTISFVSDRGGVDNIWAVPIQGRNARRITANAEPRLYLADPIWSPDARKIYYSKQRGWNFISTLENFD
ncbi:MAG TPA: protein kinase [Blastocatellia bacterium]|nr:protein kinase [Blastocatellia bacterium]